jgi:fumarate hydratase class II
MSTATTDLRQPTFRVESDSIGEVKVPGTPLWGAQTQRSLEHFSIGKDLIPREMISAYAILKKSAANANRAGGRLNDDHHELIVRTSDEIPANRHQDMFPLHVQALRWAARHQYVPTATSICRSPPTILSPPR